jgi:hypothetical protein
MGMVGRCFKQEKANNGLIGQHQAGILIIGTPIPSQKEKRSSKKHFKDYWTRIFNYLNTKMIFFFLSVSYHFFLKQSSLHTSSDHKSAGRKKQQRQNDHAPFGHSGYAFSGFRFHMDIANANG